MGRMCDERTMPEHPCIHNAFFLGGKLFSAHVGAARKSLTSAAAGMIKFPSPFSPTLNSTGRIAPRKKDWT
jgi:hypothetical protein